jgi:hypothetical protein
MSFPRSQPLARFAWLLVPCIAAAVGCRSCWGEPEAREREPLSLIPDDSLVVGSAEMGPLRSSSAYKRVLRQGNPMAPFLGDCAYDPLPDVDRVWFGGGADLEQGRGSIVVMGPVDREKVLDCFRNELRRRGLGLEEVEIEGFTAYSAGPGRPHLAWVDRETLLIGDRDHVERMLALEKGKGRSVRSNTPLIKLYERVAQGRDVAVAAIPSPEITKRLSDFAPEDWRPAAEAEQIAIGARVMKGVDLVVTVRLKSGDEAQKLLVRLEGYLERWRDHDYVVLAGVSSHLKAVRLAGAGPEITASASWTDKQVDTLARLAVDSLEVIMREGASKTADSLREKLRDMTGAANQPADGGPARPDGGLAGDGAAAADAAPAAAAPAQKVRSRSPRP